MNELSDSLGQLSTHAKEWRPSGSGSGRNPQAQAWQQPQQQQQQHTTPSSFLRMTSGDSTGTSASASGINVNASNWVPQSVQQQQQSQTQQTHYPYPYDVTSTATATTTTTATAKSLQHEHLDQLTEELKQQNLDDQQQEQEVQTYTHSIPKGPVPPPHQQTFNMNHPISLPLPKTLLNENHSTALGGSGGSRSDSQDSSTSTLPNHLLAKLYKLYHVDCSTQMEPDDERYKAIPQSFVNAMPLENTSTSTNTSATGIGTTPTNPNSSGSMSTPSTPSTTSTSRSTKHQRRSSSSSQTRSSFGYPSSVFKVTSVEDGRLYCLRRFDTVKCVNSRIASQVSNMWNHAVRTTKTPQHNHSSRRQRHNNNNNNNATNATNATNNAKQHVLNHPGLVRFYKAFYVNQNRALFFIHEYYPNAYTLREVLFRLKRGDSGKLNMIGSAGGGVAGGNTLGVSNRTFHPLHESVIWSYVTQLVTAIKNVHMGDLAVRVLQLNHILVTNDVGSGLIDESSLLLDQHYHTHHHHGQNLMTNRIRLRINCLGVVDALEYESRKDVEECQKEDMRCLGRIIMSLATGMEIASDVDEDTLRKCDNYMSQAYSPDLYNLTMALITKKRLDRLGNVVDVDPPNIQNVCRVVGEHALDELDSVHVTIDKMDEALAHEYESGRGLRLLLKLGFINERPEFGVDTRWSESGDCYVLKLFRDYVFHQADGSGRPVMDLGHVITALNKLDTRDEEKIVLASRDGKSIMVVSFADVAHCLENAYAELCANSATSAQQIMQYHHSQQYH